jgi:hypothetical protein
MLSIAHFSKNVKTVQVKSNQMAKFRQSGHTESAISHWREPKSCLSRVVKFKLGSFA